MAFQIIPHQLDNHRQLRFPDMQLMEIRQCFLVLESIRQAYIQVMEINNLYTLYCLLTRIQDNTYHSIHPIHLIQTMDQTCL